MVTYTQKRRASPMTDQEVQLLARAEAILNATLAYQAAAAVHRLKDELGIRVRELRLVVSEPTLQTAGTYLVTCTIAASDSADVIQFEALLQAELGASREASVSMIEVHSAIRTGKIPSASEP